MTQSQRGAIEVASEAMTMSELQAEAPRSPMRRVTLPPEAVVSNKRSLSELSDGNVDANGASMKVAPMAPLLAATVRVRESNLRQRRAQMTSLK